MPNLPAHTPPISVVCTCAWCGKEVAQPVTMAISVNQVGINGRLPVGWMRVEVTLYEPHGAPRDTRIFCSFACVGGWYATLDDPPPLRQDPDGPRSIQD